MWTRPVGKDFYACEEIVRSFVVAGRDASVVFDLAKEALEEGAEGRNVPAVDFERLADRDGLIGQINVVGRRLGVAPKVIMHKNQRGSAEFEHAPHDFARIDRGAVAVPTPYTSSAMR